FRFTAVLFLFASLGRSLASLVLRSAGALRVGTLTLPTGLVARAVATGFGSFSIGGRLLIRIGVWIRFAARFRLVVLRAVAIERRRIRGFLFGRAHGEWQLRDGVLRAWPGQDRGRHQPHGDDRPASRQPPPSQRRGTPDPPLAKAAD